MVVQQEHTDAVVAALAGRPDVPDPVRKVIAAIHEAGLDGYVLSEQITVAQACSLAGTVHHDILRDLRSGALSCADAIRKVAATSRWADALIFNGLMLRGIRRFGVDPNVIVTVAHDNFSKHGESMVSMFMSDCCADGKVPLDVGRRWADASLVNGLLIRAMRERGIDPDGVMADVQGAIAKHGEAMTASIMAEAVSSIVVPPSA